MNLNQEANIKVRIHLEVVKILLILPDPKIHEIHLIPEVPKRSNQQ
jgi:hypothetical protein